MDGAVHRQYGGAPDCAYVIDAQGRIVARLGWNDVAMIRHALDDLQAARTPEPVEVLGTPLSTYPPGYVLLHHGARKALLDFYETNPPALRSGSANLPIRMSVPR